MKQASLPDDLAVGMLTGLTAFALLKSMALGSSDALAYIGAIVFVGVGMILRRRSRRLLWAGFAVVIALWMLVAFSPVSRWAFQHIVRRDTVPSSVDAVIVLSAGITADGNLPPRGVDRLLEGLTLVRKGVSNTLVLTRPFSPDFPGLTAVQDQERLVALLPAGVETVVVHRVTTTRTEGTLTAALAPMRGWRHVAVVTSPSHSKRACAVFEQLGFEVSCVPSTSRDLPMGKDLSGGDRLEMFREFVYESVAISLYRYRGWVR